MRENSLDLCEIMPALRRKNISIREIYNSYSWRYGEINRIYVGTSFCGELFIKTILEDMEYIASCFGNKIRVNLTIPVFTESCFIQGKSIINTLLDKFADLIDEITVNDIGIYNYVLNYSKYKVFLGRLLRRVARDSRYKDYNELMTDVEYDEKIAFGEQISGLEIDINTKKLNFSKFPTSILPVIHFPFVFVTTGQICDFAALNSNIYEKFVSEEKCSTECQRLFLKYVTEYKQTYYRLGKAIYFKCDGFEVRNCNVYRVLLFPFEYWEKSNEYISTD